MFRFWAEATAGFLMGSFGVSGVFATEFGSSIAPASSQTTSAYFLADANFSSGSSIATPWIAGSGAGLSKTAGAPTITFVGLTSSPPTATTWSSTSLLENAKAIAASPRGQSRTDGSGYLSALEALSKQSFTSARSTSSFFLPTGNGFDAQNNSMNLLLK
jgi:hypothetical protein